MLPLSLQFMLPYMLQQLGTGFLIASVIHSVSRKTAILLRKVVKMVEFDLDQTIFKEIVKHAEKVHGRSFLPFLSLIFQILHKQTRALFVPLSNMKSLSQSSNSPISAQKASTQPMNPRMNQLALMIDALPDFELKPRL